MAVFCLFWPFLAALANSQSTVTMPESYTAMKGSIEVHYHLASNATHFKGFNAMVHIEYLAGHTSDAATVHLSR